LSDFQRFASLLNGVIPIYFELDLVLVIWDSSLGVSDITLILNAAQQGDPKAAEELLPLIYDELRRLAAWRMANERPGQTLQATALVHEAYLRLVGGQGVQWQGRRHFFGGAAEAMRRILVENARRKKRLKHGGQLERVNVEDIAIPSPMPDEELLAVDEALDGLAKADPRAAELVKLCFFVGLSRAQAAEELGISIATAGRIWAFARAWLFREIEKGQNPPV
jgi:RNA polymerase sigma factor (TIGR02999 family)